MILNTLEKTTYGGSWCAPRGLAIAILYAITWPGASPAHATYRDLIGYPELQTQLGSQTPTGSGIVIQHVEAMSDSGDYLPAVLPATLVDYTGIAIHDVSAGTTQASAAVSGHAQSAGANFYGNTVSIAPDLDTVQVYESFHWMGFGAVESPSGSGSYALSTDASGFLNYGYSTAPDTTSARIANHSWITQFRSPSISQEVLRRVDYVVDEDDFLVVVGLPNLFNDDLALLKTAYNPISVGLTSGDHRGGTAHVDSRYTLGRAAPSVVAPGFSSDDREVTTSHATAIVSSVTALLLEAAGDSRLSRGAVSNRTRSIPHAETSEVMKAVLMAGADRRVDNARGADLTTYVIDTTNNLDRDFGAGQVNVHQSYNILAGGEHDSDQDRGAGLDIHDFGWDYDPQFGGGVGSNSHASYFFTAEGSGETVSATLAWNLDLEYSSGAVFPAVLHDLDLLLIDVTAGQTLTGSGASSRSTRENTENVYFDELVAGNRYELRVLPKAGQAAFQSDYGLAWRIQVVPEVSSAVILLALAGSLVLLRPLR